MFAGAGGHQVAVDDEILVDKPGAVSQRIAVQIVVARQPASANDLGGRCHQPQPVADDALDDVLVGEGTLQEFRCRRDVAAGPRCIATDPTRCPMAR